MRENKADFFVSRDCACCGRSFRFGPGIYDGDRVPAWDVMICRWCKPSIWDRELPPTDRLLAALKVSRVAVKLNANGMLDIPN